MKAQMSSAVLVLAGVAVLAASAHGVGDVTTMTAAKGAPPIDQMVVFRSGKVLVDEGYRAKRTTATVSKRTCGIAAATAMAALVRSDPGPIGFHDYGDCTRRPADSAGLFVKAIRGERNRAQDGWVYKVGRKLATAGAADPAGSFGSGRLRSGADVIWFYCRQFSTGSCQRSLELETEFDGGRLTVTVRGYDDAGDGVEIAGATVHAGGETAKTDAGGQAALTLKRGRHDVYAAKQGAIRSFTKRVTIK
jgi:hypothetical protein